MASVDGKKINKFRACMLLLICAFVPILSAKIVSAQAVDPSYYQDDEENPSDQNDSSYSSSTGNAFYPIVNWNKKLKEDNRLEFLGTDLFGDSIDPHTGGISFEVTDVDLPGNFPLSVSVKRRIKQGGLYHSTVNTGFGDWQLVTPRIYATAANDSPWHDSGRCGRLTGQNFPSKLIRFKIPNPDGTSTPEDILTYGPQYSEGIKIDTPEFGVQDVLTNSSAGTPAYPAVLPNTTHVSDWKYLTADGFIIRCNGSAESVFYAIAPNGTRYEFNHTYKLRVSDQQFIAPREQDFERYQTVIAATRVSDLKGNEVTYEYDSVHKDRLLKIESNDGREIIFTYDSDDAGKISKVTTNPGRPEQREWEYEYSSNSFIYGYWEGYVGNGGAVRGPTLLNVKQPDGHSWNYIFDAMSAIAPPAEQCYTDGGLAKDLRVIHPYGAEATFEFIDARHRTKLYLPTTNSKKCPTPVFGDQDYPDLVTIGNPEVIPRLLTISTRSISKKTISYTNDTADDLIWTYTYEQDSGPLNSDLSSGPPRTNWTEVTNPDLSKVTFYHRWASETDGGTLNEKLYEDPTGLDIKVVRYEYQTENNPGSNFAQNPDITGFTDKPKRIEKEYVDIDGDNFTTDYLYNTNLASESYSYGKPTRVTKSSSQTSENRVINILYNHIKRFWVIGLTDTVDLDTASVDRELESYSYDSIGRKIEEHRNGKLFANYKYANSGSVYNAPNNLGALERIRDPNNRYIWPTQFNRGIPRSIKRSDSTWVFQSVDRNGWITKSWIGEVRLPNTHSGSLGNGYTTSFQHDAMGRVTRVIPPKDDNPNLLDTIISYNFGSTIEQTITRGNSEEKIIYDKLFRPVKTRTKDLSGTWTSYQTTRYGKNGEKSFVSFPSASSTPTAGTDYSYDGLGRITSSQENVWPNARKDYAYLNEHRRRTREWFGNGANDYYDTITKFAGYSGPEFDAPIEIKQGVISTGAANRTTTINRNVFDEVQSVTQSGNLGGSLKTKTQNFYYDQYGRVCRHRTPEGGDTLYSYDLGDRIKSYSKGMSAGTTCGTPSGDSLTTLYYHPNGQIHWKVYAGGNTPNVQHIYDLNGNLVTSQHTASANEIAAGRKPVRWTYDYSATNQLTYSLLEVDSKRFETSYGYNDYDALISEDLPGSGDTITYERDGLSRLTAVRHASNNYATLMSGATYHPNQSVDTLSYGNGFNFAQTLTPRLQPLRISAIKNSSRALDYTYGYSRRGKIKNITDATSFSNQSFTYDPLGQLTYGTGPWGLNNSSANASIGYDSLGNILSKTLGSRTVSMSYNGQNRLSSHTDNVGGARTLAYDSRGNVTGLGGLSFVYGSDDLPREVSGSANGTYLYDGNMKRVRSVVDNKLRYNVYDLSGRLSYVEEVGTNVTGTSYVRGVGGVGGGAGANLARIRNGQVSYLHSDHLGSNVAATNSSGTIEWQERHSPFGLSANPPAANDNQAGFTGHIKDSDTGLTYMQARYYDPVIGRFLSIDPVTFLDTGNPGYFNRYSYTMNDPINNLDPDGRACVPCVPIALFLLKEGASEAVEQTTGVPMPTVKNAGKMAVKQGGKQLAKQRAKQVRKNAADGSKFEKAVGNKNNLNPNTKTFDTNIQRTKPDFVDGPDVSDAKSVKSLSNTKQMRSQRDLAESNGGTHKVFVNADKNPKVSGPMKNSSTKIIRCNSDGTPC